MPTKPPIIFAVAPGAREIGVAVLDGLELAYYAVKTIKQRHSPQMLLTEISRYTVVLIDRYHPQILVIGKPSRLQERATLVNVSVGGVKRTAKRMKLMVAEYIPAEVRALICGREKATKREMALRVVRCFPELARYLQQPTQWGTLYWGNMFDAVAVGLAYLSELHGDEVTRLWRTYDETEEQNQRDLGLPPDARR